METGRKRVRKTDLFEPPGASSESLWCRGAVIGPSSHEAWPRNRRQLQTHAGWTRWREGLHAFLFVGSAEESSRRCARGG